MISRSAPLAPPPGASATLAVLLLLLVARSLVTFPVEHVDATFKYAAAAGMARGEGLALMLENHHTLRWSAVLPQTAVTWLTRFRYEGLYLLPLLAFALAGALLWRGLQPALTLGQQALLLVLLFIEPVALTHTGQLLNPPFGVLYGLLGVTVLARPGPSTWRRSLLAALCFFAAYGAHSTYLAFAVGALAWLLLFERRPLHAAGFLATLVALLALETMVFNVVSGGSLAGGRFELLAGGSHMTLVREQFDAVEWPALFTRWLDLPLFDQALTAGFLLCAGWLSVDARARRAAPPFLLLCLLVGGAYALAVTVAVVDLHPLRPIQPLRVRYLEPFLPYAIAASVYLAARLEARFDRATQRWLEGGTAVVMVLLLAVAATQRYSWEQVADNRLKAFAWRAEGELSGFAQRFRDGELLLVGHNRRALEHLVRYQGPLDVRRGGGVEDGVTSAPLIVAEPRCIARLRAIPVVLNERPCAPRELRLALQAGSGLR